MQFEMYVRATHFILVTIRKRLTKKKILARTIEYQQNSFKGKWNNFGTRKHTFKCHGQLNWFHLKTMARERVTAEK